MINLEQEFRKHLFQLDDFMWTEITLIIFRKIMCSKYQLSETFLREFKNVFITSIFNQLLKKQKYLSDNFNREIKDKNNA